jgi:hypothetical protein
MISITPRLVRHEQLRPAMATAAHGRANGRAQTQRTVSHRPPPRQRRLPRRGLGSHEMVAHKTTNAPAPGLSICTADQAIRRQCRTVWSALRHCIPTRCPGVGGGHYTGLRGSQAERPQPVRRAAATHKASSAPGNSNAGSGRSSGRQAGETCGSWRYGAFATFATAFTRS